LANEKHRIDNGIQDTDWVGGINLNLDDKAKTFHDVVPDQNWKMTRLQFTVGESINGWQVTMKNLETGEL
jgi:hypothetical protein